MNDIDRTPFTRAREDIRDLITIPLQGRSWTACLNPLADSARQTLDRLEAAARNRARSEPGVAS